MIIAEPMSQRGMLAFLAAPGVPVVLTIHRQHISRARSSPTDSELVILCVLFRKGLLTKLAWAQSKCNCPAAANKPPALTCLDARCCECSRLRAKKPSQFA